MWELDCIVIISKLQLSRQISTETLWDKQERNNTHFGVEQRETEWKVQEYVIYSNTDLKMKWRIFAGHSFLEHALSARLPFLEEAWHKRERQLTRQLERKRRVGTSVTGQDAKSNPEGIPQGRVRAANF